MDSSPDRVRLVVDIDRADDTDSAPSGQIDGGAEPPEDFLGWTSLAAAIQRRRSTREPSGRAEATDGPGGPS